MSALIFDTETNGRDKPCIIEAAYVVIESLHRPLTPTTWGSQRFNPGTPSTLAAIATHHILEEELEGLPHPDTLELPPHEYLIGHNIDFDHKAIGCPEVKLICTLALARKVWPDLDSHKQVALAYHLNRSKAKSWTKEAHSALADVRVCFRILGAILDALEFPQDGTFEDLWKISERARIPTHMAFGKHKGEAIADLPSSYKKWILGQPNFDPYIKKAIRGDF